MTAHAKVTTISHSASGMGKAWYRVTGSASVASTQVAYRVGTQDPAVRRVRFVGEGGTARLLRFTPGRFVTSRADMDSIARAFTGEHLTHGVKTKRSKLARVPAAPVHAVVSAAMAAAGLEPSAVFTSRDAQNWWRSLSNATTRDRSVSFLTADGLLRATPRAGAGVAEADLHAAVGAHWRGVLAGPVDVRRRDRGVATLLKSFSQYAVSGDPAVRGQWLEVMETAASRALEQLMAEAGFCSNGHRGDGQNVQVLEADGWAGFIATEISSREGDPHLHVHCTLPNVLVGRDDVVRTMADGGRELIVNAPRFAAWGQAFVIQEATARGLIGRPWFNLVTRQWEVGTFTADGAARDQKGRARADRSAKRRATAAKDEQPTWEQLRRTVVSRAVACGVDLAGQREGTVTGGFTDPGGWSDEMWISFVARVTCEHESTTSLAHVRSVIDLAGALPPAAERARLTGLVLEQGFTRGHASRDLGMKTRGQRWISTTALHAEERLLGMYVKGRSLLTEPGLSRATADAVRAFAASTGWPPPERPSRPSIARCSSPPPRRSPRQQRATPTTRCALSIRTAS